MTITRKLKKDVHATCLLILFHADILDLGEKEHNTHAVELGTWLRRIGSGSVKILVTSRELLDWCATGEVMDLKGIMDPNACNISYGKGIHEYFGE